MINRYSQFKSWLPQDFKLPVSCRHCSCLLVLYCTKPAVASMLFYKNPYLFPYQSTHQIAAFELISFPAPLYSQNGLMIGFFIHPPAKVGQIFLMLYTLCLWAYKNKSKSGFAVDANIGIMKTEISTGGARSFIYSKAATKSQAVRHNLKRRTITGIHAWLC